MPSLKALRVRIRSVRSTQKITSAMKVVAASRLRHAVERVEAARPYAQRMERVLGSLAGRMAGLSGAPPQSLHALGNGGPDGLIFALAAPVRPGTSWGESVP